MDKKQIYLELVKKRKDCRLCKELTNTSTLGFETDEIGKWSEWQGSLDAKILVIGQDFSDVNYWIKNKGTDSPNNKTNETLKELFSNLGYDIGTIYNPLNQQDLFFTNAVLCLKKGGMSADLSPKCFSNCNRLFLTPLIDLLKPKFIITIGSNAYKQVICSENKPIKKLNEVCGNGPIKLVNGIHLFPVFHCGGLGLRNRSKDKQISDWKKIKQDIQIIENK